LRGAGHSFGIVTSLQLNVYDVPSNWTVSTFIYSSDKLEAVLDVVNKVDSDPKRPANLVISGVSTLIPPVDHLNVNALFASISVH
jgi:hypothetical protein